MEDSIDLNACNICAGALRLVDGTDPDEAADTGVWEETYECERCGRRGRYKVNQRAGTHSGTGVVRA